MKGVYGLYPDGHSAQQAFNRLRAAGVAPSGRSILRTTGRARRWG